MDRREDMTMLLNGNRLESINDGRKGGILEERG